MTRTGAKRPSDARAFSPAARPAASTRPRGLPSPRDRGDNARRSPPGIPTWHPSPSRAACSRASTPASAPASSSRRPSSSRPDADGHGGGLGPVLRRRHRARRARSGPRSSPAWWRSASPTSCCSGQPQAGAAAARVAGLAPQRTWSRPAWSRPTAGSPSPPTRATSAPVPWGRPDRFKESTVVTEPGGDRDPVRGHPAHRQRPLLRPLPRRDGPGERLARAPLLDRTRSLQAKRDLAETLAPRPAWRWWSCSASRSGCSAGRRSARCSGWWRPCGGPRPASSRCGPTRGGPTSSGVAARGFDATLAALRRSQAELEAFYRERMVRADRFAAVGEMATGLAHEIKNPLAGLSGALELLAEDLAKDPRHAEVVGEMRHQVQRLTHTMESLLSFARPPKARLTRHRRQRHAGEGALPHPPAAPRHARWRSARAGHRRCRRCWPTPRSSSRSSSTSASTPSRPCAARAGCSRVALQRGRRPRLRGGGRHRPGHPGRAARPPSSSPSSPPSGRATASAWPSRRESWLNTAATSAIGARRRAAPSSP